MNQTGTYVSTKQGIVKVSDQVPSLSRPIWAPKGDLSHYDPSAKRVFESKADKRRWLKANGLREGGIINPDRRLEGHFRNSTKRRSTMNPDAKAWMAKQGGTQGLLDRLQRGGV